MSVAPVHLFVDYSNIFRSAAQAVRAREGLDAAQSFRLDFHHLFDLAAAGRDLAGVHVVGPVEPARASMWHAFTREFGVSPELYELGASSGTEQGVDQCLQVHMLRAALDHDEPQVAVLMTGDGAGHDDGIGFHADLERMYKVGWGVEVMAWEDTCNWKLRQWARQYGAFVPLERYYDSIVYINGMRVSEPLDLAARSLAEPSVSAQEMTEMKMLLSFESNAELERRLLDANTRAALLQQRLGEVQSARAAREMAKRKYEKRYDARGRKSS